MKINFAKFFRQLAELFGKKGKQPKPYQIPWPPSKPTPVPPPLGALSVNGKFFESDGRPFTVIACTDFRLFQMFLNGEDILPILQQRTAVGFNTVRVLGMCALMFDLSPRAFPNYYDSLDAFIRACARQGLYVEFVVFADATIVMPSLAEQLEHWHAIGDTLADLDCLVELVNENSIGVNTIQADAFPRDPDLICAHGSNGSQEVPVRPAWDYETFHTNDSSQWWRKVGHNAMECADTTGVPCVANENTRFPDKCSDPSAAFDAAAGAALLTAGSTFHSVRGKSSELWDGLELECAQAWVNGATSVPLHCQRGGYEHLADREETDGGQTGERVYRTGGDEACVVRIRPH